MNVTDAFEQWYSNATQLQESFCPYRVCPLGAHSDHQLGIITGFALDKGITLAYTPDEAGMVTVRSLNQQGEIRFFVKDILSLNKDWGDYLRGATAALRRHHSLTVGLKGVFQGTLPIGGLSSSAALIICFLKALCTVNGIRLTQQEMINTALWAERNFVGVNVGKLDQSCEVLSKKDHLLYLDTKDDSYTLIPQHPNMKPYEIAIFFSGLQRSLVGSAFNMRVDECKGAAYALKAFADMEYGKFADTVLRDVPPDVFEAHQHRLPEPWRLRATHFYTEFQRVQQGAKAWEQGDLHAFGKLIFESGQSSIQNYQTGSPELIALYDIMKRTEGVYGGRFSGAGFKGCCMALIDPSRKESIARQVTEEYGKQFPQLAQQATVHFCQSSQGVEC